jgi:butyryl-CoA dehydrogenase
MRLEPTMKQMVIRRTVRKFAEERIAPATEEIDRTGAFPMEIVEELGKLHYFGLEIPAEYGGAGLDAVSYAIVVEEISRTCAAFRQIPFTSLGTTRSERASWCRWRKGKR